MRGKSRAREDQNHIFFLPRLPAILKNTVAEEDEDNDSDCDIELCIFVVIEI